ncbi:hypothetical protein LTR37_021363 [Vermiconidia calcicola]|uniref:Uncharacterized protein n=1 Tax=Vermiconidia calcicola TaxID=1690605 RepID=A0ACC3M8W3_9PEZI|nr:hypothetical protein LTR37_021363 [Vermiconidia calcicola]
MPSYTWLITGASSGLGASIAHAALDAGHTVIAAARNVAKGRQSHPEIERKGGRWLTLDVTLTETHAIVAQAVRKHNVNVVVNNAGYALRGVLEDLSMDAIRAQFETNLIGALTVTKASIPHLRAQRSGTIVNISSTSGISGNAGYSLYAASKFALEGASESLAAELAPFKIRVLVVEPGAFRTNFQSAAASAEQGVSDAYKGTPADAIAQRMRSVHGTQAGDPAKAGQAIVEVVTGQGRGADVVWNGGSVLRLPLGKDAVQRAYAKLNNFSANVEQVRHISEWAIFDE